MWNMRHEEGHVGFIRMILFLMNHISTHFSDGSSLYACVFVHATHTHTHTPYAVKNHNSSATVSLVVGGDSVLPRLLVEERSLHWSLTGFHSNGGGSSRHFWMKLAFHWQSVLFVMKTVCIVVFLLLLFTKAISWKHQNLSCFLWNKKYFCEILKSC